MEINAKSNGHPGPADPPTLLNDQVVGWLTWCEICGRRPGERIPRAVFIRLGSDRTARDELTEEARKHLVNVHRVSSYVINPCPILEPGWFFTALGEYSIF